MSSKLFPAREPMPGVAPARAPGQQALPESVGSSLSAAAASLVLHGCGFLLLVWLVRPPVMTREIEPLRTVQIVLAQNVAPQQVQYFDRPADRSEQIPPAANAFRPAERAAALQTPPEPGPQEVPAELRLPALQSLSRTPQVPAATGLLQAGEADARIPLPGDLDKWLAGERARLQGERPAGEPAPLSLFGGPSALGRSFVFLIDRSKSMGQEGLGALQAAEEELLVALQPLQSTHQFQVIAYHHQCVFLHRRDLLPATQDNKQAVRGFLSGLAAFGATEHEMALQTALAQGPDVIYLLTDGGDPGLSDAQIRRLAKLAGGKTRIHCVQFGYGIAPESDHFLRRLAAQGGGGYVYVNVAHAAKASPSR